MNWKQNTKNIYFIKIKKKSPYDLAIIRTKKNKTYEKKKVKI